MLIHFVPVLVKKFYSNYTWHKNRGEKKIYLTFDDGPVPGVTDVVLNQLAKRGMKATFFMVGDNVAKNPSLALEVLSEGHQIGNHTHNHLNGATVNALTYYENVLQCADVLKEKLEIQTSLFRPPYGKISREQFQLLKESHQIIMWDVLSGDYSPQLTPETCLKKTIKYTQNGSIVVFHDQMKSKRIIESILDKYLDFIEKSGFETACL